MHDNDTTILEIDDIYDAIDRNILNNLSLTDAIRHIVSYYCKCWFI